MDKEDVVCVCVCVCVCVHMHRLKYYSAIRKKEVMPYAGTWMALEITILSEVRQRQIPYDITYMWNLKYDTNEHIYETETYSEMKRTDLWLSRGRKDWGKND